MTVHAFDGQLVINGIQKWFAMNIVFDFVSLSYSGQIVEFSMLGQVFDLLESTKRKQLRSELVGVGINHDNKEAPFDVLCSKSFECFNLVS